mgnify:CR=1 FL=1
MMFLRLDDELVNINAINSFSIEEELISSENRKKLYVIATTNNNRYLLGSFNSRDRARSLIDIICEELETKGMLIGI